MRSSPKVTPFSPATVLSALQAAALPMRLSVVLSVVLAALLPARNAQAGETAVNIFGLSRHFKESADGPMREFNPGAGLHWTFAQSRRASLELNVGVYRDSFDHANWHWSLGGRWRVAGPLSLGLQAINSASPSFSDGYPTVAPYPFAALAVRDVTVNLAYLPEIGTINGVPSLATYVTVWPWGRRGRFDDDGNGDAGQAPAGTGGTALEFDINGLLAFDGFLDRGITWQRRFDGKRGLRLGLLLSGSIETSDRPNIPDWGNYEAAVLVQYMRRLQPRGRVTPYWATGIEADYYAANSSDSIDQAWRTDLGAAYRLDESLALAFEYSLRAELSREAHGGALEYTDSQRHLQLGIPTARLALVVERATAPPGTPTQLPVAGRSLAFSLSSSLYLRGLREYSISWRTLDGPARAWRFALSPALGDSRDDVYDGTMVENYRSYALGARAERHFRLAAGRRLATYWGVGPVLRLAYSERQREEAGEEVAQSIERVYGLGATALVGMEYAFATDLYALVEWSTDLTWQYRSYDPGPTYRGVSLGGSGTRLGVGVPF